MNKKYFYGFVLLLQLIACAEPPTTVQYEDYQRGVFAVNEGIFGQSSGTISYFDPLEEQSEQRIFKYRNQRDLGDVVQSLSFINQKAYIVVNNSNKIEIADANSFEELGQINSLKLPRYIEAVSATKAYISEWGSDGLSGQLSVLDLQSNSISKTILVDVGPEQLFSKDQFLYVSHSGGFGNNNKISLLDTTTDQVVLSLSVGDRPGKLVQDNQDRIWVLCAGKTVYSTYPAIDTTQSTESMLISIDGNNSLDTVFNFGKANTARYLNINAAKSHLYYYRNGWVWSFDVVTNTQQAVVAANLYGMTAHPTEDKLYLAKSTGIDAAEALIYTNGGSFLGGFTTGYFTNGFVFK